MSDEAKVAYLQEKMREARRNQILSYVFGFAGMFLVDFYFIFVLDSPVWDFPIPLDYILGLAVLLTGFTFGIYYGNQKGKFMEQLKELTGFESEEV